MLLASVRFFTRGDVPDKLCRMGSIDATNVIADTEEEIILFDMGFRREMGMRLQEQRLKRHLTEADVGAVLDVCANQVSRIENGQRACTMKNFLLLIQMYECSADYILFGKRGVDEFSAEQLEALRTFLSKFKG